MVLVLISGTIAGCTSDPDGGGGDEIDSDALQDLFDEHFQDFINNTTITVNNHYYNNTTYVVDDGDYSTTNNFDYNNTTNVDGGEVINNYNEYDSSNTSYSFGGASFGAGVNGSVSGSSMMFVAHVTFTAMDLFPDYETIDYRSNTFTYNYTYYDYLTNTYRTEDFTYSCQVFYLIGSLSNNSTFQVSYWDNNNNYWDAWDNQYNNTIADMLDSAAHDDGIRRICDEDYIATMPIKDGTDGWEYTFLSIDIPQGYAIQYLQINSDHSWYGCTYWLNHYDCENPGSHYSASNPYFYNYSEGPDPRSSDFPYYGGWDNLTVDFDIRFYVCCWDNPGSSYHGYGEGEYSLWPTSEYEFTMYYQFVPVMPVE